MKGKLILENSSPKSPFSTELELKIDVFCCRLPRNLSVRAHFPLQQREAFCRPRLQSQTGSKKCGTAPGLAKITGKRADVGIEGAESVVKGKNRRSRRRPEHRRKAVAPRAFPLPLPAHRKKRVSGGRRGMRKECTTERAMLSSRCKLFALFPVQPEVPEMARRESRSGRPPHSPAHRLLPSPPSFVLRVALLSARSACLSGYLRFRPSALTYECTLDGDIFPEVVIEKFPPDRNGVAIHRCFVQS